MQKLTLPSLSLLILLSACSGIPSKISPEHMQPANQVAVTETPQKNPMDEKTYKYKKVCKTYASTGTRFTKKICRSQQAWDEIERKAKDALYYGTKPHSNNPSTGG